MIRVSLRPLRIFQLGMLLIAGCLWAPVQSQAQVWMETYGGAKLEEAYAILQVPDGGYLLAGSTESEGAGNDDVWLVKIGPDGKKLWGKTYGGSKSDRAYALQPTADGGYVIAGKTESFGLGGEDVYLLKTDAYGKLLWSKTYGGTGDDRAYSVRQTADGGFILAGRSASIGKGNYDMLLTKTDPNGDNPWTRSFGGVNDDRAYCVRQTSDGGYILAGSTESMGKGGSDMYLVKADANGLQSWTWTYGGANDDRAYSVLRTPEGGYLVAGYSESYGSGSDVFLVKTDSAGKSSWQQVLGGAPSEIARDIAPTQDGGYIICGSQMNTDGFDGTQILLMKANASGKKEWSESFGSIGDDCGYSVCQSATRGYVVAGALTTSGNSDMFSMYYSTPPTVDMRINGKDVPLTLPRTGTLNLRVSLNASGYMSHTADWWLMVLYSGSWFHFDVQHGQWINGIAPSLQGPLMDLSSISVFTRTGLPTGTYTFYFAVDTIPDGLLSTEAMSVDGIQVVVTP